ncbi:MAG TPA: DMT family transporter [Acidisarcina sp.]
MLWIVYVVAALAGAANPFQSGANAQLNKQLGQPLWAGLIVYFTGMLALLAAQLVFGRAFPFGKAGEVSWWAWLGGLISIGSTMAGLMLAQRLGSGLFTGLSITAALITSVVLDQFGLLGFRQHSASPARLAGCALLIAGVWLVARF